ncbi:hypothetical protein CCAN2_470001 [Capnocytophaga canimorsus]|nr:hypothetical protein CCAN2_470001 [Capnocytophaga canimorsus]
MLTAGKEVSDALQNYHSQHEYILVKPRNGGLPKSYRIFARTFQ